MATVRQGSKAALVVVDVQVGVVAKAWQATQVVAQVARAVARARAAHVPVLWVQHENDELPRGSAAWHWVGELVPAPGEPLIPKRFNSGFEDTALEATLAALEVSHIVLAGAATNWCIRATAYAALERGYYLTLVADAHTTDDQTLGDGTVIAAEQVVRDLNTAMTWLQYPGRRNATARAEAVDFTRPAAAAA
jgi:nicotinamidase-related amidase